MLDALLYLADKALDLIVLGFLVSAAYAVPTLIS